MGYLEEYRFPWSWGSCMPIGVHPKQLSKLGLNICTIPWVAIEVSILPNPQ